MVLGTRQIVYATDLPGEYTDLKDEMDAAISSVLASGDLILGKPVTMFEQEFAAVCASRHAVGVANCTEALFLSLRALGIGQGDEVITTPVTFVATVMAIMRTGARPVFADIDMDSFNIDPEAVAAAYTSRTRAVVPVHLYGLPADMDAIVQGAHAAGAVVVGDAAQAAGSRYDGRPVGSLGNAAVFSFFPTKNLGCYGDGGAVVTDDSGLAEQVRLLREHGLDGNVAVREGINSRLDALQAAVLSVKLRHLDEQIERRIAVAARYNDLLSGSPVRTPQVTGGNRHSYYQYTIVTPGGRQERDETYRHLRRHGVDARLYYSDPLQLQPAMASLGYRSGQLPGSETFADTALSLPCHPRLTEDQQVYVCRVLLDRYGGR
jgi:dTDP-4-amino-4,6-dideoxygalactose transaminase